MDRQVPLNVFPNTAMKVIPLVGAELYYDAHFLSPEEATILFNILFNKCPWVRRKGMYGRPVPRDEAYYGDPGSGVLGSIQCSAPRGSASSTAEPDQLALGGMLLVPKHIGRATRSAAACVPNSTPVTEECREVGVMWKHLSVLALTFCLVLPGLASDRDDDVQRIHKATQVFQEVMNTPDKGIPQELLESAKCLAIIPGEKKAAFVVGGDYGKGLATCRTSKGWSAPLFLAIGGGSVGFQIGGSSTDIVMLFMNDRALQSLLSDKFKIGADATAAAGPVGRHAEAGTDVKLNAEILTYSRSKGAFAGISLDGAVVQADRSGDQAMYGTNASRQEILSGSVPVPASAQPLVTEISKQAYEGDHITK